MTTMPDDKGRLTLRDLELEVEKYSVEDRQRMTIHLGRKDYDWIQSRAQWNFALPVENPITTFLGIPVDAEGTDGYIAMSVKRIGPDLFGIGRAVDEMKDGKRVARQGWNGKGMWLSYVKKADDITYLFPNLYGSDCHGVISNPFVVITKVIQKDSNGEYGELSTTVWTCSQADLLAEDWMVVE